MLIEVPDEPTQHEAQAGVRRALGDPSLELLVWLPDSETYVDAEGRPVAVPEESEDRAVTRIDYENRPVGAFVHDPALRERPDVLDEVAAAARVALEKDRSLRALRESETRSRAVLDALPDLMFRISRDGVYLDYRAPSESALYAPEVLGRTVHQRLPEIVADAIMDAGLRALAGDGVQTIEYELSFDGDVRDFEGRITASGENEFLYIVRDISERKRHEEQLQRERDLVRTVVDTAPTLFAGVDPEGRVVRFNRALERLSGRTDGRTVRGRPFWESFVAGEEAREFEHRFREDAASGEPREHESTFVGRDGARAAVLWSANPYRGEGGAARFLITGTNITERKEQERELRREGDFVTAVIDILPGLLAVLDLDGRVVRHNEALWEFEHAGEDEELHERPFWELFADADESAEVRDGLGAIAVGRSDAFEWESHVRRRDGDVRLVAWAARSLGENGGRYVICGGLDVTERQAQAEELERQRDFLNALANNTPSLLCLVDDEGRIPERATNTAFERLLQVNPVDVGGKIFWDTFAPPEELDEVRERIERVVAGEAPSEHDNHWLAADGTRPLIAWSCVPLPQLDERRLFLVCGVDITERQRQERELRLSRARLVEAGDAERRRLERNLHDGAQQRLVSLSLALRLAQARVHGDPIEAQELLEAARVELGHALEELRELARGIHPAVLTDRGLPAALENVTARSPIPVDLRIDEHRLPAPVEAAAYYVVSEALANVAKYAHATEVAVRIAREDGRAVVEVRDDGIGGADPARGTGLRGLADRVAALDGRLAVESRPGRGTWIRAEIPVAAEVAAP
jgi:PAS domain S-box-containing protein